MNVAVAKRLGKAHEVNEPVHEHKKSEEIFNHCSSSGAFGFACRFLKLRIPSLMIIQMMPFGKGSSMRIFPKILGREEPLLAGFGISGGKTAVKAALLAEEIGLDPIGQGIEAEVWNAEHAAGRQEHVSG